MTTIGKHFYFESAHFIPGHPTCGRLHGHTWKLTVMVKGDQLNDNGMLIDFKVLGGVVRSLIGHLDHGIINDYFDGSTPLKTLPAISAETLCAWFVRALRSWFDELDFLPSDCLIGCRLQEGTEGGWAECWEE